MVLSKIVIRRAVCAYAELADAARSEGSAWTIRGACQPSQCGLTDRFSGVFATSGGGHRALMFIAESLDVAVEAAEKLRDSGCWDDARASRVYILLLPPRKQTASGHL